MILTRNLAILATLLLLALGSLFVPASIAAAQGPDGNLTGSAAPGQVQQGFGLVPSQCVADVRQCDACALVAMAGNIISLLFQVLVIVAVIMIVMTGLRLVTSGGNVDAMQKAKSMFANVIIGFIIVMAAWLIVDTIFKVLIQDQDNFGVWNRVRSEHCGAVRNGPLSPEAANAIQRGGSGLIQSEGGTATP